jgi:hypothetical protein
MIKVDIEDMYDIIAELNIARRKHCDCGRYFTAEDYHRQDPPCKYIGPAQEIWRKYQGIHQDRERFSED